MCVCTNLIYSCTQVYGAPRAFCLNWLQIWSSAQIRNLITGRNSKSELYSGYKNTASATHQPRSRYTYGINLKILLPYEHSLKLRLYWSTFWFYHSIPFVNMACLDLGTVAHASLQTHSTCVRSELFYTALFRSPHKYSTENLKKPKL